MIHTRALFVSAVGAGFVALALAMSPAAAAAAGTVGTVPASYTPWLLKSTVNQMVEQLLPCGDTMFAVGPISAVGQGTKTYSRANAFSFSASTGAVTAWNPKVNGPVRSVALSPNCATAYLGGQFTSVNGAPANNIAAVDAVSGALLGGFAHTANSHVDTLQYTHGVVLAGGAFTTINGTARTRLASLNPSTGAVTSYVNLAISGAYPNTGMKIYNSQLSHSGTKLLVEGVFTSIGGLARQQVAMLDLGVSTVTVDNWYATELNQACVPNESFYARSANWSPADDSVYVATTGYKPPSGLGSNTQGPRAGMCDAAIAFPATSANVSHKWVAYTGCDSYYAVAADANNVYVSGHERWANNGFGCDYAGPGAVSRPGIASLNPANGLATEWNPTRDLGYGSHELVVTAAGLWVASDIFSNGNSQKCGGVTNKGGICFFPY